MRHPDELSPAELQAISEYISFGAYTGSSSTPHTQVNRAKHKLHIIGYNHYETFLWVLKHHPDWIIPVSPLGEALSQLLSWAKLGRTLQAQFTSWESENHHATAPRL